MKKYAIPATLLTILIVTFVSFYPCLGNGFTRWDDNCVVTENKLIRDISPRGIVSIFLTANNSNYNPLTLVSYAVEYRFAGLDDPFVFHATNLALHLLNSAFVFWFIFLISRNMAVSAITALLFGIHPMHVESVAWIAERKDVLYSFFFLSSLIAYVYYTEKSGKKGLYYLSLCFFLLSMLSKTMAVTMPAVLLLVDYLRRRKIGGKVLLEKAPFLVIACLIGAAGYFAQRGSGALSQAYFGPAKNAMVAVYGLEFYLKKLFFPTGLSAFYPYPADVENAITGMFLAGLPLLLAAAAAVIVSARYTRKAVFGALFFLVVLSPVLKFIPLGRAIAADRYVYIAYIGLFYVIAEGLCCPCRRGHALKYIISAATVAAICFLSFLTWQRCFVWKDDISLWNDALKLYPSTEAYFGRGVGHANAGRIDDAMRDYNKALEYDPYLSDIYTNRGILYAAMGQAEKALEDYSTAIMLSPGSYRPYYNRGLIYGSMGDFERSVRDFDEVIKLKPDYAEAYSNRGAGLGNMGRGEEALLDFNRALLIDPGCIEARRNKAVYYDKLRGTENSGKNP